MLGYVDIKTERERCWSGLSVTANSRQC